MMAGILASVDAGEAERTSERIRRKLLELAKNGEIEAGHGDSDTRTTA